MGTSITNSTHPYQCTAAALQMSAVFGARRVCGPTCMQLRLRLRLRLIHAIDIGKRSTHVPRGHRGAEVQVLHRLVQQQHQLLLLLQQQLLLLHHCHHQAKVLHEMHSIRTSREERQLL